MKSKKTDNRSLERKIELRTKIIEAAGFEEVSVLDACAGEGQIWTAMRNYVNVVDYLPCDIYPRIPGTLKGDAHALLKRIDLSRYNVIDLDTYGSPWEMWYIVATRIARSTAVFLTRGYRSAITRMSDFERWALEIPADWQVPVLQDIPRLAADYALQKGLESLDLVSGVRYHLKSVDYYGLAVTPDTKFAGGNPTITPE